MAAFCNSTIKNVTFSISCFSCSLLDERYIWNNTYLSSKVYYSSVAVAIAAGILCPFITLANVFVFFAFLKIPRKQPTDMLLCSLSVTDFITGVAVLPLVVFTRISETVSNEKFVCNGRHWYRVVSIVCVGASIGHLTLISIERAIGFTFVMKAESLISHHKILAGIVFTWFYSMAASVASSSVVRPIPWREMALRAAYYGISFIFMACCYGWILRKLKRDVKSIKKKEHIEKILKEAKLAKTMAYTCFAFAAFFLPETISNAIVAITEHSKLTMVHIVLNWTQIAAYSNSLFNPIWYSFSIPFIRRKALRCFNVLLLCLSIRKTNKVQNVPDNKRG